MLASGVDQGTDVPPSERGDSSEPPRAGPEQHPHQDRLGLVVHRVRGRDPNRPDPFRHFLQEGLTAVARRFFGRAARDRRRLLGSAYGGRQAERGRLSRDERRIRAGALAQAVVEVCDVEVEVVLRREAREDVQHRQRIGSAGNGEQRPLAAFEEASLLDRAPDGRDEVADRARLLAHTPTRESHASGARISSSEGMIASLSQTLLIASRPARSATAFMKRSPTAYWSYFISMPIAR